MKCNCCCVMLASTPRHRMRTDGDSDDTLWHNEHKLTVHMGAFCISKGEDSCCFGVAKDSVFLGVADGVGGSRRKGGNPALFAQTLLNKSLEAAQSRRFDEEQVARNIVNEAFTKLVEDFVRRPVVPFGSSTICVALIDPVCGKLKFANVGDSGLIVLRHVALGGGYKLNSEPEVSNTVSMLPIVLSSPPIWNKLTRQIPATRKNPSRKAETFT